MEREPVGVAALRADLAAGAGPGAVLEALGALDRRSLLDRIDFIIPFFPIKDPEGLKRLLEQKLRRFGCEECPAEYRQPMPPRQDALL